MFRPLLFVIPACAAITALMTAACDAADWDGVDARVLGRAGVFALDVLDLSPGAPVAPGIALGLGRAQPFAGSGLVATSVRARIANRAWGAGVAVSQLGSDVHRESDVALAVQLRGLGLAGGAALELGALAFAGQRARRDLAVRCGLGLEARARLAALFEFVPGSAEGARVVVAAGANAGRALELSVQCERRPRLPLRLRAGGSWRLRPLELAAGYDTGTRATAGGLEIHLGPCSLVWSASSHPDLGWSHAWMLEFRRS